MRKKAFEQKKLLVTTGLEAAGHAIKWPTNAQFERV
jgi:hypothetical protein